MPLILLVRKSLLTCKFSFYLVNLLEVDYYSYTEIGNARYEANIDNTQKCNLVLRVSLTEGRETFRRDNFCKDHRDKTELPDPLAVEDLISYKLNNRRKIARHSIGIYFPKFRKKREREPGNQVGRYDARTSREKNSKQHKGLIALKLLCYT